MPHAALTVAQRESLYAGMIAGTFPAALLGELTAQAAARGVEQGTWLAQIISLCDVPLDELLSRQHSAAEALLATRVLAAAREEAVRIASAAYPAQTTVPAARPRRTGAGDDAPAALLRRILDLGASIGPETSLDACARHVAQGVSELGGFSATVLFLLDVADDAFYAESMHGLEADAWQEVLAVAVPSRVYARLVAPADDGAVVLIRPQDGAYGDPEVAACLEPLRIQLGDRGGDVAVAPPALLILPLATASKGTIGFCLSMCLRVPPRPGVRRALRTLGGEGARWIENIHRYRMQSEEAAIASALLQVAGGWAPPMSMCWCSALWPPAPAVRRSVAALLYLDGKRTELRLLEPKGPDGALNALTEVKLTPARLGQLEPLLRGKEPLGIEDGEIARMLPAGLVQARGLRSALMIPLKISNRPADALAVFWTAAAHRFSARDLEVARGIGELVGVALANAQLFTDATNRAEQLSSLYRTGQMMSSSLDLEDTLRTITAAAVQLTRSRAVPDLPDRPELRSAGLCCQRRHGAHGCAAPPAPPWRGLLGRCALLGKPLLIDDLQAGRRLA